MPYQPARTYRQIATRLVPVQAHIKMIYDNLGYPKESDPERFFDVRPDTLSTLLSETAINVMVLNILASVSEGTIPPDLFRSIIGHQDRNVSVKYITDQLSHYHRLTWVTMIQFRIENMLVNILAVLDKTQVNRSYHNNVQALLDLLKLPEKERNLNKLMVLQHIRNSLHSNGVHNNKSMSITIDNIPFVFEKGKPVGCAGWDHIIIAFEAALIVLEKILSAPEMKTISEPISPEYIEQS
ncbi:MAG TPA: hypothetical protein VHA09_08340 [Nitrososphaera sp.]|nr:hypothetical protein [Nitrososphaera sp.]